MTFFAISSMKSWWSWLRDKELFFKEQIPKAKFSCNTVSKEFAFASLVFFPALQLKGSSTPLMFNGWHYYVAGLFFADSDPVLVKKWLQCVKLKVRFRILNKQERQRSFYKCKACL